MLYQSKPEVRLCTAGRYVLCKNMFAHFQNFKMCPLKLKRTKKNENIGLKRSKKKMRDPMTGQP